MRIDVWCVSLLLQLSESAHAERGGYALPRGAWGRKKLAVVQNGQNRKSGKGRWHGQWGVAGIYVIIEQVPGVNNML